MSNPSRSLNCRLCWTRLLPSLGVEGIRTTVLPQVHHCPACPNEQLHVYDDRVCGGQWVHCRGCGFSGDLVELAAHVWKIDVPAALAKLGALGILDVPLTDEEVEAYVRDHVDYRRRLHAFWEQARGKPKELATPSIRNLLNLCGLMTDSLQCTWDHMAGQFIGSANFRDAEELFGSLSYQRRDRANQSGTTTVRRGGGPGGRRIFKGHEWGDVLVIPFFDLPYRLSGFLFVGRNADPQSGDFVYKRANLGCSNRPVREAGVGMLPVLDQVAKGPFSDAVFVMSDLAVGLLLQSRWMKDSYRPLPIVLSHYSPQVQTLNFPDQLADRKLIFWGTHPKLICQARRWNGLVSRYRISQREIQRRLDHRRPLDWLRLIHKNAVPWWVALQKELQQCDLTSAEEMLRWMELTPAEMRQFLGSCRPALRERLEQCDPHRIARRQVVVSGKRILETNAGWEIERTGEKICNMPIRIEEVLSTEGGETYYRGVVPIEETPAPFCVPASSVEKRGLFPCVRDDLVERGTGVLNFDPRWSRRSAFIAMELNAPEFITGADRIGYHRGHLAFLFPEFAIHLGGGVSRTVLPLLIDDNVPAKHLKPPGRIYSPQVAALSARTTEVSFVWAMMASITHNIFNHAMYGRRHGIILDGKTAQTNGPMIARTLGCAEVDLRRRPPRSLQTQLERIEAACSRHNWPTVVRLPQHSRLQVTANWIDTAGLDKAILSLDAYTAPAVASYPGFIRIFVPGQPRPLGDLCRAISELIPNYIQDLCRRKLGIEAVAEHEVFNLLEDVGKWFKAQGGAIRAVRSARHLLSVGGHCPWESFMELVFRMCAAGDLHIVRSGFDQPDRKHLAIVYQVATDTMPAVVWIPAEAVNQVLARRRSPVLDLKAVEESLKTTDVWKGVGKYRDEDGWLLDEDWWGKEYIRWQKREGVR
ncbi:hypothetical protein ACFL5Q_04635 [Planctomycetota bacterium]